MYLLYKTRIGLRRHLVCLIGALGQICKALYGCVLQVLLGGGEIC